MPVARSLSSRLAAPVLAPALAALLGGCVAAVAGGAAMGGSAAHDRRDVGTWVDDKRLYLAAFDSLNKDKELALRNHVAIVVYDGVMLLVGEVRTDELKARAQRAVSGFAGPRRIVNELAVREPEGSGSRRRDNTITAHVKTALLDLTSLPGFDPTRVNVTTAHRVVYLMGRPTQEEDEAVPAIARDVAGVERVVKVFDYVE